MTYFVLKADMAVPIGSFNEQKELGQTNLEVPSSKDEMRTSQSQIDQQSR